MKELLKSRDDVIFDLAMRLAQSTATNTDHLNTILGLESELVASRATAAGRGEVIESMERILDERWQRILAEGQRNVVLSERIALVSREVDRAKKLETRLAESIAREEEIWQLVFAEEEKRAALQCVLDSSVVQLKALEESLTTISDLGKLCLDRESN